jgi:2-desacetyl-2-hydroxyethyl bacteriochlorophyllide A dehydrogenase
VKAILLEKPGQFALADLPEPGNPGPGQALVQVHRVGICGTDLHAFEGDQPFFNYPRILGHELGVEVLEVGHGVDGLKSGDLCCVEPYLNCGQCVACRRGRSNCCVSLKVLGVHIDGGMRGRFLVPADKLHYSRKLTLDQLALVETLAIGSHAVDRAQIETDEFVLVVGAGPIGLSVMQFAQLARARIVVLDVNPARLDFCKQQLGIEHCILAGEAARQEIEVITQGTLPTVVFDATGNARAMMNSFQYVASSGKLVFVGVVTGDISFPDPLLHRRELSLLASRNALPRDFVRILHLIERGRLDTTPWITHHAEFDEMIEMFPKWLQPETGVIKAMLRV